jgi:aldehyde dehydrogenase (NAD+)
MASGMPQLPSERLDAFFIGGEWVAPSTDQRIPVVMPSTEDVWFTVPAAAPEDVMRAVAAARRAFDHGPWPRLSASERAHYLRRLSQEVVRRHADLATLWTGEVGALLSAGMATFSSGKDEFARTAVLAETFPFEERREPGRGGKLGLLVHEPVGVVAAIVPWNGPFLAIAAKCAPALLAGCTIIVKSSPEAPGDAYLLAEMAEAIGLPPGVINVITADRDVSELLVTHPDVDKITFTGSTAAGKRIGALCGGRIARCTLELGGKSPAVILDDYDPAQAARSIAAMAPNLSGQVCSSLTRLIVPAARHDEFVDALAAEFAAIRVGDPFDPATRMGPLATLTQRERVEGYIAKGIAEGAILASGGHRPHHLDRGYYIEPTIFARVDNAMTIAREEIFGPVVSVIAAASEAEAIAIANDSDFGLNASVFTNDPDRAYAVARQLQAGTVGHNSWRTDFSLAFGGFKRSGIGREGGTEGIRTFTELKTVILDADPSHYKTDHQQSA